MVDGDVGRWLIVIDDDGGIQSMVMLVGGRW